MNIKKWLIKLAAKEVTIMKKTGHQISFKPFLLYQGLVVLVLIFAFGGFFAFSHKVDDSLAIKK